MNNMRWVNQSQPQTLYAATILAYFRAVLLLINASNVYNFLLAEFLGDFGWDIAWILVMFGMALGGLGVANEKKWGYWVLGGTGAYTVIAVLWVMQRFSEYGNLNLLLRLMFDGALVVLLFHPMSKEYRKVWFR